ncbi:MAG: hypothetical protein ACYS9X_15530 [Planctomycetota bacterium]|jgi:hypothetical protein
MTLDEAFPDLVDVVSRYGARPDLPMEAGEYFAGLAASFDNRAALRAELDKRAREMFKSLRGLPEWIQEPEWPWSDGKPMVFVGSIDAPQGTFHDDARFFVFWSPDTGARECIIQIA